MLFIINVLIVKLLFINCEIDAGKSCFLTPPYLVFNAVRNFVVYPPFNLEVSRILEDARLLYISEQLQVQYFGNVSVVDQLVHELLLLDDGVQIHIQFLSLQFFNQNSALILDCTVPDGCDLFEPFVLSNSTLPSQ